MVCTPRTLSEIYSNLQSYLEHYGYTPRRQNVSLNIRVNGYSVDLVPAKHQDFRAKMARSLILTTDIGRFTVRRARLAPASGPIPGGDILVDMHAAIVGRTISPSSSRDG